MYVDYLMDMWSQLPVDAVREQVEQKGLVRGFAFWAKLAALRKFLPSGGQHILNEEWDICIVLDACRADLLADVVGDHSFLDTNTTRSVGSATFEWMPKTFSDDRDFSNVTYVCANPFSGEFLNGDDFELLEEVWRTSWDPELGTVPADSVTDATIRIGRELRPERLLIHYMQPHVPFVPSDWSTGPRVNEFGQWGASSGPDAFEELAMGLRDEEEVWTGYTKNLDYVLSSVSTLLENVDGDRVVITSDHGNAFGEWGLYGHYSVPLACLRTVPWCTTTAKDQHTRTPNPHDQTAEVSDRMEMLRSLGYR